MPRWRTECRCSPDCVRLSAANEALVVLLVRSDIAQALKPERQLQAVAYSLATGARGLKKTIRKINAARRPKPLLESGASKIFLRSHLGHNASRNVE